MTPPQTHWMSPREAAQYLRVNHRTLLLWIRQGKIPAYALSGTKRRIWRLRKEELDSILLGNAVIHSACLPCSQKKEQIH